MSSRNTFLHDRIILRHSWLGITALLILLVVVLSIGGATLAYLGVSEDNFLFAAVGAFSVLVAVSLSWKLFQTLQYGKSNDSLTYFSADSAGIALRPVLFGKQQKYKWSDIEKIVVAFEFSRKNPVGRLNRRKRVLIVFLNEIASPGSFLKKSQLHHHPSAEGNRFLIFGYPKGCAPDLIHCLSRVAPDNAKVLIYDSVCIDHTINRNVFTEHSGQISSDVFK